MFFSYVQQEMSDVESEVTDATENPNPESDIAANSIAQNEAAAADDLASDMTEGESDRASISENASVHDERPEGINGNNIQQLDNQQGDILDEQNENEEEGDQLNEEENQSVLLAEGDQYRLQDGNDNVQENDLNNCNSLAAEDEQYIVQESVSQNNLLQENVNNRDSESQGAAACTESKCGNGRLFEEAYRTESCGQLEDYAPMGAYSQDEYQMPEVTNENEDVEGAYASAQGDSFRPESEADEKLSHSGANESVLETEPTESDQEGEEASSGVSSLTSNVNLPETINHSIANPEVGAAESSEPTLKCETKTVRNNSNKDCTASQPILEDEISVLVSNQEPVPDSYEPECDQSELEVSENHSSQVRIDACSNSAKATYGSISCEQPESTKNKSLPVQAHNNQSTLARYSNNLNLSKEKGAIPKQRKTSENESNGLGATSCDSRSVNSLDSAEDELLSELDATLRHEAVTETASLDKNKVDNSVENESRNNSNSAMGSVKDGKVDNCDTNACDQCKKNNLQCSFKSSKTPEEAKSNQHTIKELKGQLKQANQMMMEKECEINR